MANGIFSWGIYFGYGLAYIYGKYLSDADILGQGWRAAYVIGGGPGILIGVLILLILRETRNTGTAEKKEEDEEGGKTAADKVKELLWDLWTAFRQPTLLLLVISASVRQIAGLAWANNNVNYFTEYYPDKVMMIIMMIVMIMMMMTGYCLLLADRVLCVRRGVRGGVWRLDHGQAAEEVSSSLTNQP